MGDNGFFETRDPRSTLKSLLVEKYFRAWAKVVQQHSRGSNKQILYLDLFAGPGRYEDGSPSTPLQVIQHAIADPMLRSRLVTMFNDKNPAFVNQLRDEIAALPGLQTLAYQPKVWNEEVGDNLIEELRKRILVPTLFFIDPWGYKGLSLELIGQAIRSWGCDCIFFFNYNRINMGLANNFVRARMTDLCGAERLDRLIAKVDPLSPAERQEAIVTEISEALQELGGRYVLSFEFRLPTGTRTSHYVIFVSKHFRGYHIMKEVMAGLSTDEGEVKQLRYLPPRATPQPQSTQLSMFPIEVQEEKYSIAALKEYLVQECAGKTLTVWEIYETHSVDTPYTIKNVRDALRALETERRVTIDPPASQRRKVKGEVTLAKDKRVTFPD